MKKLFVSVVIIIVIFSSSIITAQAGECKFNESRKQFTFKPISVSDLDKFQGNKGDYDYQLSINTSLRELIAVTDLSELKIDKGSRRGIKSLGEKPKVKALNFPDSMRIGTEYDLNIDESYRNPGWYALRAESGIIASYDDLDDICGQIEIRHNVLGSHNSIGGMILNSSTQKTLDITGLPSQDIAYLVAVKSTDGGGYKKLSIPVNNAAGTVNVTELPPGKYEALLYVTGCNTSTTTNCTFDAAQITFTKDQETVTQNDSELQLEFEQISNKFLEACRGSLDCANCIGRYGDGKGKVGTFGDAAKSLEAGTAVATNNIYTAIGCVDTSDEGLTVRVLQMSMGAIGGLIIIRLGQAMVYLQKADPESYKEGSEIAWSAFIALVVLAFGVVGMMFLGVNIFKLFSPGTLEASSLNSIITLYA